jgi:hypothetical protein
VRQHETRRLAEILQRDLGVVGRAQPGLGARALGRAHDRAAAEGIARGHDLDVLGVDERRLGGDRAPPQLDALDQGGQRHRHLGQGRNVGRQPLGAVVGGEGARPVELAQEVAHALGHGARHAVVRDLAAAHHEDDRAA